MNITDSLFLLVLCLLKGVPLLSVFSIAKVAEKFAEIFEAHTCEEYGIQALKDPYYDATFTFCTSETLKKPPDSLSSSPGSNNAIITLHRADMSYLEEVTAMYKAFSETTVGTCLCRPHMNR